MTDEGFKDLPRRKIDEVLRDKIFNIVKYPKLVDINVDLLQWFINSLIKKFM